MALLDDLTEYFKRKFTGAEDDANVATVLPQADGTVAARLPVIGAAPVPDNLSVASPELPAIIERRAPVEAPAPTAIPTIESLQAPTVAINPGLAPPAIETPVPVETPAETPALPVIESPAAVNPVVAESEDELTGLMNQRRALTGKRNKDWSLGEKIGSAALGWLTGGIPGAISAGTDREYFNKLGTAPKIANIDKSIERETKLRELGVKIGSAESKRRLDEARRQEILRRPQEALAKHKRQLETETEKFNNRMKVIDRQADIKAGEAKRIVKPDGTVWLSYTKKDSQGNTLPEQQVFKADGSPEMDPNYILHEWIDPTGKTVMLKAKDIARFNTDLAVANTNRIAKVEEWNAQKDFEAQKFNAEQLMTYNNQLMQSMQAEAKGNAALQQTFGEVQGLKANMDAALEQYRNLQTRPIPEGATDAEIKAINEINKPIIARQHQLVDSYNAWNKQLWEKSAAFTATQQQLKNLPRPAMPQRVTAPVLAPRIVAPGAIRTSRQVFLERIKGYSKEQQERAIAAAERDGVIPKQ